jgi:uncharacterized cupredoxin-like copper-binding protein
MKARAAPLAVLAAVALTAAGIAANAPAGSTAPRAVKVVLKEWTLKPSAATVPAGPVIFVVHNTGGIPHEFVVVRTNRHHHALAMHGGQAVEAGQLGEIGELKPGQAKRLTVRLRPGKYVLLCNLPGHYKAGQYAALRVT